MDHGTTVTCIEETANDRGDFAGSFSPLQRNFGLPGPSTLDHSTGRQYQKVVFPNQEEIQRKFLQSGRSAVMKDETVSCVMMERAMPLIANGTANFAYNFHKKLEIQTSCFEDHHFEKRRDCGSGATGEVQSFFDPDSRLDVVRKRFVKGHGQRGSPIRKEEVQSLVRLRHPGVVRLYALLCTNQNVDLLMEDAGYPLRDCLKEFCQNGISGEKYWQVVEDLAGQGFEALSYIHEQDVCHMDVKPENFLARTAPKETFPGSVTLKLVLGDFGSAVPLSSMMTFSMALTRQYWAPELWLHAEKYLHKRRSGVEEPYKFYPRGSFDTYAMGLCVCYMGNHRHLVKDLEDQQKTVHPVIPPQDVEHALLDLPIEDRDFVFKLILMKQYGGKIPEWALSGRWVFPGISPSLQKVIWNTLQPDPEHRWTEDQATSFLTGEARKHQTEKKKPDATTLIPSDGKTLSQSKVKPHTQPGMKTPTPIQDSSAYMAEISQREQVQGLPIPVPEASQQAAELAVHVGKMKDQPDAASSETRRNLLQKLIPLMEPWDQNARGPQEKSLLKQGVCTSIARQTQSGHLEVNDISIGSHAHRIDGPARQQPANHAGIRIGIAASTVEVLQGNADADFSTENKVVVLKENERKYECGDLEPQGAVGGSGLGKGKVCWGEEGVGLPEAKAMRDQEGIGGGKILNVQADKLIPCTVGPPTLKGKGKGGGKGKGESSGKGGGKWKPVRLGGKRKDHREVVDKVKAGSAITKAKGPAKKIPFFVASSSRPKLRTLSLKGTNAPHSSVETIAGGSCGLDRPPDAPCVGPQGSLGCDYSSQPKKQSLLEDMLLGMGLSVPGQSHVTATAPTACQQLLPPSEGNPFYADPPRVDEQKALDQNQLEELGDILEEKGIMEQLPAFEPAGSHADFGQQTLTEGEQAAYVYPAAPDNACMSGAEDVVMEDEQMLDISEEMPLVEVQGNLPDFEQLFDR
ncbi:hypothetical protein ACOMHN_023454 [Nucella lapillus]